MKGPEWRDMDKNIDFDQIDLELPPPKEEPFRQYYFIAECRRRTAAFKAEHGRSPRACVFNMGCPFVNV